jgi:hypothetical protein
MSVSENKLDVFCLNVIVVDEVFCSVQSTIHLTPVTNVNFVDSIKFWMLRISTSKFTLGFLWNKWTITVLVIIWKTIKIKIDLFGNSLWLSFGIGKS